MSEQATLKWLTIAELNSIDRKAINCSVVAYPASNDTKVYKIGVYFYPDRTKK